MSCLAILVNYHCAKLIVGAVESLAEDPECDLIHVVDNSGSEAEEAWLRQNLPARVKLIVSPQNVGFAQACNLALEGVRPTTVLLLNPDARLSTGALGRLKKTMDQHKEVGAVGPRVFWDDEKVFFMPPSTYPSRSGFMLDLLGSRWPWIAAFMEKRFRQQALVYWTANKPIRVAALSGGHVLLRHQALVAVGGLFDPQFFMYWEDTDLMRRFNDQGWKLLMEPRATAIHWYEHSTSKDQLIERGWSIFRGKYYSNWLWRQLMRFVPAGRRSSNHKKLSVIKPSTIDRFVIQVPEPSQASWVLEISPSNNFIPAIGRFGQGPEASFSTQLAERFKDRDYYVRVCKVNGVADGDEIFVLNSASFTQGFVQTREMRGGQA